MWFRSHLFSSFVLGFHLNSRQIGFMREAAIKPLPMNRRIEMKATKEQETKTQPKNGKAAAIKIEKPGTEVKRTIKQAVIETITANNAVTNDEMTAAVKAEFPKSAFKDSHAAWYRSQARKGLLTGTPIVIPARARKNSKAAN